MASFKKNNNITPNNKGSVGNAISKSKFGTYSFNGIESGVTKTIKNKKFFNENTEKNTIKKINVITLNQKNSCVIQKVFIAIKVNEIKYIQRLFFKKILFNI